MLRINGLKIGAQRGLASSSKAVQWRLAPGVVVERRTVVWWGLAAIGSALAAARCGRGKGDGSQVGIGRRYRELDHLVEKVRGSASGLVRETNPDEMRYVTKLKDILAAMNLQHVLEGYEDVEHGVEMEVVLTHMPLVIYEIRMAKYSTIELHDHQNYNGVILCAKGQVRCRSFEVVREHQEDGSLPKATIIRETKDDMLIPGKCSTLTRHNDNLHELAAGNQEVSLIDVFTLFEKDARSRILKRSERPIDVREGLYEATWVV